MSTLPRVLEPEYMDTADEAETYDAIAHGTVNSVFVDAVAHLAPQGGLAIDLGCGTLRIPILLAERASTFQIIAVDAARHMLNVGLRHLTDQPVLPLQADCKRLPFADDQFDVVLSNSLVHHLPDPAAFFIEIARIVRPGGAILIRDLFRPPDKGTLTGLVERYAANEPEFARRLFHDSLHAALTVDEVQILAQDAQLTGCTIEATSDRHWTLSRPR